MSAVENRRTAPDAPPEKLSEEALSQKLGGYQRTELLSMLFTILGVIAGIVLLFLHRLVPAAVLIFAAIRSCYTASLRHMGDLLDVLRQDTELFHAAGNG